MITNRSILLALPLLLLALLPLGSTATAASALPGPCPSPGNTGPGKSISITLDWQDEPLSPGFNRSIGIHVTNTGNEPTTEAVRVVGQTQFGPLAYDIPAGLAPGATHSTQRNIGVPAGDTPGRSDVCDFTATYQDDCTAATYNVVVGERKTNMFVYGVQSASGKPGENVAIITGVSNGDPSASDSVTTITAPAQTTWSDPLPESCAVDATRTTLTCDFPKGLTGGWGSSLKSTLTIAPDALPGSTLQGGFAKITDPYDPTPDPGKAFTVTVV